MNEHDIFLAAIEIEDLEKREKFLIEACAGDPSLWHQVNSLLAVHEQSGEFLDVPLLKQMAGGSDSDLLNETSSESEAKQEEIDLSFLEPSENPNSLGRLLNYEVKEFIGRGGCGMVFKSFDETLERIVAIKVMLPELAATSPARKRFLREARATAAIRHENVVGIYNVVEEHPLPFLVMEYIAGDTLQQKLDRTGPLDVKSILRIGMQIASALAAAHSAKYTGLVHRDIKPGNILLEEGTEHLKVTDFGLARSADDASMTQSGMVAGTPQYMSPEQVEARSIDHRSDLFSLGSVLYVMSSGRPPFRASSMLAVMKRVVEDQPRPIQEIIPGVPDWLVTIIAKLQAKNPDDRFASAQEVEGLLRRCLVDYERTGGLSRETLRLIPKFPEGDPGNPNTRKRRYYLGFATAFVLLPMVGLGVSEATGVTRLCSQLISPSSSREVAETSIPVEVVVPDSEPAGLTHKQLESLQWMIAVGGTARLVKDGKEADYTSAEGLPEMPYEVRRLSFHDAKYGEEDIDRFKTLPQPTWSIDFGPSLTDEMLARIAKFRNIVDVSNPILDWSRLTDSGMVHLQHFPNKWIISISNTAISGQGLKHIGKYVGLKLVDCENIGDDACPFMARNPSLRWLTLDGTEITDVGLSQLAGIKTLEQLSIRRCNISESGVRQVAKALPGCQILWDGGTIKPSVTLPVDQND